MATIVERGVAERGEALPGYGQSYAPAPVPTPDPAPDPARDPRAIEFSILDILLVLARRARFILLITIAAAAIGLTLAFLRAPAFTARTVILPPQQSGSASGGLAAELSSLGALGGLAGGGLGIKNPADMYVALFRSDAVELGLLKQFDLPRLYRTKYVFQARAALEGSTRIVADPKSGLITISFTDGDPRRAAAVTNGYVEQYRHLSEHLAISEAAQRRLFFQQQLTEAKNNLAGAEEALVKTQQTTGLLELNSQARVLIESAAQLRAQVAAKQVQIQSMQTYAAQDNAGLVQAEQELAGLRTQLAKLGGNGDPDSGNLNVTGGKVPTASLEYARHLRDVKYNETIFNILARQFEAAKLDEAREGALVQVVDPATPPEWKSSPKRSMWALVSFGLGFVLSCTFVLVQAALRVLRRDPETDRKLRTLNALLLFKRIRKPA